MDPERLRVLEQVIKNSKPYFARLFEPRLPIISAGCMRENIVEPLDCKITGNCIYTAIIKPDRALGALVVSLIEEGITSGIARKVSVYVPFTRTWGSALVCKTAEMLAEAYTKSNYTHQGSIPEKILKQLIAGRILYYKNGGSAQNKRN